MSLFGYIFLFLHLHLSLLRKTVLLELYSTYFPLSVNIFILEENVSHEKCMRCEVFSKLVVIFTLL